MKTWKKPELMSLNVQFTNEGGLGGRVDGVNYTHEGSTLITVGTSGPSIDGKDGYHVIP